MRDMANLLATAATHGGVISRAISNGKRFSPLARARVSRVTRVSGWGRGLAGAPHGIPGNTGIQGITGIAGNTGIATAAGKENDAPGPAGPEAGSLAS